jgi:hypothetical protein
MSSLVIIRFVICFLTLIRRGLSRNSSNERYRKSRCILAKYFKKATANVKTLLLEDSHSYFASVFLRKSVSVFALIVPDVDSQNAFEALLIQSADLRVSSVFLYAV